MNKEYWMSRSPFTDEYLNWELEAYHRYYTPAKVSQQLSISLVKPKGRIDDYLNKNYRSGEEFAYDVPVLKDYKNRKLWMSLTPMELQSLWVPLACAADFETVITSGLGLGYFAIRAAQFEGVKSVIVLENNRRIINTIKRSLKLSPKIQIVCTDARKWLRKESKAMTSERYNSSFTFLDHYENQLMDEMLEDWEEFRDFSANVRFWTQEKALVASLTGKFLSPMSLCSEEFELIRYWQEAEFEDQGTPLTDLYDEVYDSAFVKRFVSIRDYAVSDLV